jgi:transcriptional regulator with XRE-family HTH domain
MNNLTQVQMGKMVGIAPNTVARLERNEQKLTMPMLKRFAKEFGITTFIEFGCQTITEF